jgi:hypothetical protein
MVDAITYLDLGHVFAANMTGNVVLLRFGLVGANQTSVPASLVSLAAFLVGAALGGRLARAAGRTVFLDHARGARSVVGRLTDLRCARCHGPVYADPFETRQQYRPVLELERPRRGRPPRWLVEQHLAERQAT